MKQPVYAMCPKHGRIEGDEVAKAVYGSREIDTTYSLVCSRCWQPIIPYWSEDFDFKEKT